MFLFDDWDKQKIMFHKQNINIFGHETTTVKQNENT